MKMFRVIVNGNEYKVAIEELPEETEIQPTLKSPASPQPPLTAQTSEQEPAQEVRQQPDRAAIKENTREKNITAPMPGTIISVGVEIGTVVSKGKTLLVLEAMKMENEIKAPWEGTVKEIMASPGKSVNAGDILVVVIP